MSPRSILFLFALLVLPALAFLFLRIFGENRYQDIPVLVDQEVPSDWDCPQGRKLDFELFNQRGRPVQGSVLRNRVTVVNFFQGSCQGVESNTLDQQARVYNHFLDHQEVQLLSISLSPCDSLGSIGRYSREFKAHPSKWQFLYGEISEVKKLLGCGLVIYNGDLPIQKDLDFVVLDTRRRVRGYYNPLDEEEIDRLIAEVQILALDYNQ